MLLSYSLPIIRAALCTREENHGYYGQTWYLCRYCHHLFTTWWDCAGGRLSSKTVHWYICIVPTHSFASDDASNKIFHTWIVPKTNTSSSPFIERKEELSFNMFQCRSTVDVLIRPDTWRLIAVQCWRASNNFVSATRTVHDSNVSIIKTRSQHLLLFTSYLCSGNVRICK